MKIITMMRFICLLAVATCWASSAAIAQGDPTKGYETCKHWELIEQLRAYEDTLAFEASSPDTLRREYGKPVTDVSVTNKLYRVYRCAALLDSITALQAELKFQRASPPVMDTDSISLRAANGATLHGKVVSDGDTAVTAQWFRYGLTALNLTDSVPVTGTTTPFSAAITGLVPRTQYFFAAFAKNAVGTSTGDTLSFWTKCGADSILHQAYYYGVIQADNQCWLDENLKVLTFNNGDTIPTGQTNVQWAALTTPGRAAPNGNTANVATHGWLYNGHAVLDPRGMCPSGWHVPSELAFDSLATILGGVSVAGDKLKATAPDFDGTDEIGFRGLPAGRRRPDTGAYQRWGTHMMLWTSSYDGNTDSSVAVSLSGQAILGTGSTEDIKSGLSVRCIQD